MPKVTVVMPAYRVGRTINDAVGSVLAQTFTDFELLVINDGCPQHSGHLANAFGDRRIRVIDQANRGLAGARNTGILQADGEYIAFIDSDDLWHPRKLELHVALLEAHPKVGVSYSASKLIDDDGRSLGMCQRPKLEAISARDVFCRNPVGNGSAPVVRRDTFDDIAFVCPQARRLCFFDESFRQSEDIECWVRIALRTDWAFRGIAKPLTEYRVSADGLSAQVVKQYESWQRMVESARRINPEFVARHGDAARAYQLRYLARRLVRIRHGAFALRLTLDALSTHPAMVLQEPVKTLTTLAASGLLRLLGETRYDRVEGWFMGSTSRSAG